MSARPQQDVSRAGYTLIEAIIAISLLVIAVAGAAMLARTMLLQQEAGNEVTKALNTQEQAARLFQLGLNATTITNILPEACVGSSEPDPGTINLTFSTSATNVPVSISGGGNATLAMERAQMTIRFPVGQDSSGNTLRRTNSILAIRPSIR